jgi:hypothetical protein
VGEAVRFLQWLSDNFAGIITAIASIAAAVASVLNQKYINRLRVDVDGRLTRLLELTAANQRAEGVIEGRALGESEERGRIAERERTQD